MNYKVIVHALPSQSNHNELVIDVTLLLAAEKNNSFNGGSFALHSSLIDPDVEIFGVALKTYWGSFDSFRRMRSITKRFIFTDCTWKSAKDQAVEAVNKEVNLIREVYKRNIAPFSSFSYEGTFE
jgi:hypothetical protein